LCHVRGDRVTEVVDGRRARDRTAERIERRGSGFSAARRGGLVANPRGEMARQDGNDEKGPEREIVLRIRHPQRVERLREEEIVRQDAEEGGEDRRVEAAPERAQQGRRQGKGGG